MALSDGIKPNPAFESSTASILFKLMKSYSGCQHITRDAAYPPIRDLKRLSHLTELLSDTANPVSAVESAIAELAQVDKMGADQFKQQLQSLKQKWKKNEITQNDLNGTLTELRTTIVEKHLRILKLIEEGTQEGIHTLREEIRNDLDPLESKVHRLTREQNTLKDNLKFIFNGALASLSQRDQEKLMTSLATAFETPKLGGGGSTSS